MKKIIIESRTNEEIYDGIQMLVTNLCWFEEMEKRRDSCYNSNSLEWGDETARMWKNLDKFNDMAAHKMGFQNYDDLKEWSKDNDDITVLLNN